MVRQCFVCKKYNATHPNLSFHKFPSDQNLRNTWFQLLGFSLDKVISKRALICSSHFNEVDFNVRPSGLRYLKNNAIPLPFNPMIGESQNISSDSTITESPPKRKRRITFKEPKSPCKEGSSTETGAETDCNEQENLEENIILEFETALEKDGPSISNINIPDNLSSKTGSSTTTLTASETEEQLLRAQKELPSTSFGTEFRGRLALVAPPIKRKRKYVGDITHEDFSTPKKAKRNINIIRNTVITQRRKIKNLQKTVTRLRHKITNINGLLKYLKDKLYISETSELTIKSSISGSAEEIFNKMLKGNKKEKFNPALRTFALTLSFYSPRAYNFVRTTFNKCLPHPSTISKWYQSVDGSPGFNKEALVSLNLKVKTTNYPILCNLVMDEMAIRKQIEWTGSKFTGYVDIGTKLDSDTLPEAKEVLVFMLVCLNGSWKIPVGYFLLDGLAATEKAGIVKRCLEFVHESGICVTSLTFDGAPVNISMAEKLGANFKNPDSLKTSFEHPVTGEPVFIFLDACHMIKLVRNCFGSQKNLKDLNGNQINWFYLEKLVEFQNKEGLHAATKIRTRHLQFAKEKMRVKIATQTLSKSVADALLYLGKDLNIPDFQNVEPTANFLLIFNDLFDILNSRNRFAKYKYKRALSQETYEHVFYYLGRIQTYILNLKIGEISVLKSPRKTGFLGLLICIESLQKMYELYVVKKDLLKYILTYKLSQDHLELFFGTIRSKGGYNNNPTARQFEASFKRLIVHTEVTAPNTGNAQNLEAIPILFCSSSSKITQTENNENLQENPDYLLFVDEIKKEMEEHQFISNPSWFLTEYANDVVAYIAGFVTRQLKQCVTCVKCLNFLEGESSLSLLQNRKEYYNLTKASKALTEIGQAAEKYFRFYHKTTNIYNKKIKNPLDILVVNTLKNLPLSVFDSFGDHFYEDEGIDGHALSLIKLVLKSYFNLRIHHEDTIRLELGTKDRVRSMLTKTILFKNQ